MNRFYGDIHIRNYNVHIYNYLRHPLKNYLFKGNEGNEH